MRVLVVSHPPLSREFGGAQSAMNLAEALRIRGHDAFAWSPEPLRGTRWWNHWLRQRRAIERFSQEHGPFDVIDTQAISASRKLARSAGRLVVRSVQPELLYLASNVRAELRHRTLPSPAGCLRIVFYGWLALVILGGWRRADRIVCLGQLELGWMGRRFGFWSKKLRSYVCAADSEERDALAAVCRARATDVARTGTRFLWIGRWVEHKGIDVLLPFLTERAATHPADSFTIAGCGSQVAGELPSELLRTGRIRVVPSFQRTELPRLLADHDAGLFTSTVEGWGITLNEMLESGLPVYATEAGGVGDLRPYFPRSLLTFPPPPNLPADLVGEGAGTEYFERFSWSAVACEYEESVLGTR